MVAASSAMMATVLPLSSSTITIEGAVVHVEAAFEIEVEIDLEIEQMRR